MYVCKEVRSVGGATVSEAIKFQQQDTVAYVRAVLRLAKKKKEAFPAQFSLASRDSIGMLVMRKYT
jgi:hypothetical protein